VQSPRDGHQARRAASASHFQERCGYRRPSTPGSSPSSEPRNRAVQEALARAIERSARRPSRETSSAGGPAPLPTAHRGSSSRPGYARRAEGGPRGKPGLDEESVPIVVRVNAVYPLAARAARCHRACCLTLPPLPSCLHYRFVVRDLVLVDSVAQLIVDVLPAAAPDLAVK